MTGFGAETPLTRAHRRSPHHAGRTAVVRRGKPRKCVEGADGSMSKRKEIRLPGTSQREQQRARSIVHLAA